MKTQRYFVVSKYDFNSGDSFVLYSGNDKDKADEQLRIAKEQDKALNDYSEYQFLSMVLKNNELSIHTERDRVSGQIFLRRHEIKGLVKLLGGEK